MSKFSLSFSLEAGLYELRLDACRHILSDVCIQVYDVRPSITMCICVCFLLELFTQRESSW